jgi:hypothetical protein
VIPIVMSSSALWLLCAASAGVYATDIGIECRPFGDTRKRLYAWSQIRRFVVRQPEAVVAVFAELRAGRLVILPMTKGWGFQQREVRGICDALNRELSIAADSAAPADPS